MHLIEREEELIYQAAVRDQKNYLNRDWHEGSYYKDVTDSIEIEQLEEYDFSGSDELKEILKEYFREKNIPDELVLPITVGAMKLRNSGWSQKEVPDKIYNF